MMFICKDHVQTGIKKLDVPHIKKINMDYTEQCFFCDQTANYKLYYSVPFLTRYRTRQQMLVSK